jgi:TPR repeat protein
MAQSRLSQSFIARSRRNSDANVCAALRYTLFCAVALLSLHAGAQSRGLAAEPEATAPEVAGNGSYYALVIGINDYRPPLSRLKTAVNDAEAVGRLLHDRYAFKVTYLLDDKATRFNILDALDKYRNTLNENDNLLIYYAGHGFSDRDAEKAYWLPVDADSGMSPNRIIADDLTTGVRVLPSRHVLIISDSCYSGALTRDADAPVASDGEAAFIRRMLRSRSRTLMASGGDEPVSDSGSNGHSVFASAILHALSAEDQSMFTASDLFYGSVRQQVAGKSEQMPQYSIIRNSDHDEGDFVFMRVAAPAPKPPVVAYTPPPPVAARPEPPARSPSDSPTTPDTSAMSPQFALGRANDLAKDRRYADAAPLMQFACDGGAAPGCTNLGWFYQNGLGVNRDQMKAVELYRKACDGGNMRGCNDLGSMHEHGTGVAKDEDEAVELYRKACDGADALACKNLGSMYEGGEGIGKNDVQAVALFRKSCDGGLAAGCTSLALAYMNGDGVGKDLAQAATDYRKACDAGDGDGCNTLGALYLNGQGVAKDESQTVVYAQKSCDDGLAKGCSNLGWLYQNGRGVAQDLARAVSLFRSACDQGYAGGCTNLGLAYINGRGVDKDEAQAVANYRRACDGGDPLGCNNLGVAYASGTGVGQDYAQAAVLARKACDGGYMMGCSNLGGLYEDGHGVTRDLSEAQEFYHRACEGGYENGCKNVDRLKSPTPQKSAPSLRQSTKQ